MLSIKSNGYKSKIEEKKSYSKQDYVKIIRRLVAICDIFDSNQHFRKWVEAHMKETHPAKPSHWEPLQDLFWGASKLNPGTLTSPSLLSTRREPLVV